MTLGPDNPQGWLVATSGTGQGDESHYLAYGSHRAACGLWLPLGFWDGPSGWYRRNALTNLQYDWAPQCPECQANRLNNQDNG